MKTKAGREQMPPVHPGEILLEDFMKPLGLSQYRVAKGINVSPRRINELIHGKRAITAETALRLERYFGWPAEVWLNLQTLYDIERETARLGDKLREIELQSRGGAAVQKSRSHFARSYLGKPFTKRASPRLAVAKL